MKTKFYTSEEIRLERAKLEAELASYKSFIQNDIKEIKEILSPFSSVVNFAGNAFKKGNSGSIMQIGVNMVVDALASRFIPGRKILSKIVLPYVTKNIIVNTLENKGEEMFDKVKSFISNLFSKDDDEESETDARTSERVGAE